MIATDRYRVLAVDDNEDVLELIRTALGEEYDVVTLSNPVDVYEILDVYEPDLLILDVMMPRLNGYQLIEMLRKNPATRELPVIMLSAKTSPGEIKHGYRLGATLYLTKPFVSDRLKKNVETQFRVSPPDGSRKTSTGHQLAVQLEMTPAFRKRTLQMSEGIMRKEQVVNARQKVLDRIKREEEEEARARRDWEG